MATGGEEDTHTSSADENSFRRKESATDLGIDDSGMGRSVLILPDAPDFTISSTSYYSMVTGLSRKRDLQIVHVPDTPSVALESVHSSDTPPQPHPNIDVFTSRDEDIRALDAGIEKLRKDYQQLKEELDDVTNTIISNQRATIEQLQNKIAEQEQQNAKLKQAEKNKDFDDIKSQMKRLFEECKIDIELLKQKVNAKASESNQESNSRHTTNHALEEDGYTQYEADFNSSHLGIEKGKHLLNIVYYNYTACI